MSATRSNRSRRAFSEWSLEALLLALLVGGVAAVAVLVWPASAATVEVSDNHGGSVAQYDARWARIAAQGDKVEIVGPCQSACTVLLGHIPRDNICVTRNASFGFHLANLASAQATLWNAYQPDIRKWISDHGGLKKDFIWMRAPDIYSYFKRC